MRSKPHLKEFANGFLDGVLKPFSRSLQWIIWLAVVVRFQMHRNLGDGLC